MNTKLSHAISSINALHVIARTLSLAPVTDETRRVAVIEDNQKFLGAHQAACEAVEAALDEAEGAAYTALHEVDAALRRARQEYFEPNDDNRSEAAHNVASALQKSVTASARR
ncbi:MAG: hypothetical protein K2X93_07990 [Candidatus Obscuribacterales bacterium]|nr:hypothetical protein [Candidatus Obscuribacterales bacterium]